MVMALGESANIQAIEGIHAAMLEELQAHDDIELDLSPVKDADVSFLQLIVAARKFASDNGNEFRLAGSSGRSLATLLERAGFVSQDNPDARAFWLEGDVL